MLTVRVSVGDYKDTIAFPGFLTALKEVIQTQTNTNVNLQTVIRAIATSIDKNDLLVDCTCPDFCLHGDTKIKLLNGESIPVSEMKKRFADGEKMWVYSTDESGDFVPGEVEDVWVSGTSNEMVEITLDNGKSIVTTPNHRYMCRDGSYVEAKDLMVGQSLMPLYFSYHNGYESVKLNTNPKSWVSVYKTVAKVFCESKIEEAKVRSGEEHIAIHHIDFNKLNNNPTNLNPMGVLEHWKYHSSLATGDPNRFKSFKQAGHKYWVSNSGRKQKSEEMSKSIKKYWEDMTDEEYAAKLEKMKETSYFCNTDMSKYMKSVWDNLSSKEKSERCSKSIESLLKFWEDATDDVKEERSKKISESHKARYASMSDDEYRIATEQVKSLGDMPKTETQREKMRQSRVQYYRENGLDARLNSTKHLNSPEMQLKSKIGRYKHTIDYILSSGIDLTEENYEKYKRHSDPHVNTYFENFDKLLDYFGVNVCYNHKITSVKLIKLDESIPVYDIAVKDTHNFYVDSGVILHNCYRFAYWATKWGYKYGKPETRPTKITNPADKNGAMCKHLTAALKNKRWIVRLAVIINRWLNANFDDVLRVIGLDDDEVFKGTKGRPSNRTGRNLGMLPLRSPAPYLGHEDGNDEDDEHLPSNQEDDEEDEDEDELKLDLGDEK